MRAALVSLLLLCAVAPAWADETPAERLKRKLAEPWLARGGWLVDYELARARALVTGLPVLVYFTTARYPSPACDSVERGLLARPEFAALARGAILYCHIAGAPTRFPELLEELGGRSEPHLALIEPDGSPLGVPHEPSLAALRETLGRARRFRLLRAQEERSPAEEVEQLLLEIDFERLSVEGARRRAARLEPTPAQRGSIEQAIEALNRRQTDREVQELEEHNRGRADLLGRLGPRLWELWREGRRPGDPAAARLFWSNLMLWGIAQRRRRVAEVGLLGYELHFWDEPGHRESLRAQRAQVEALPPGS
ncbi:MAG: hypothetical protein AB7N76_23355 [Planctomycetota bacterium]